jgi:hypothetical protein
MNKEIFYMQLCYYLLNKFSNNSIEISFEEWESMIYKYINIKHRINPATNKLEVVASLDEQ